jgi:hypothetical protein
MRETWKPTMLGLRVVPEPSWESLVTQLEENARARDEQGTRRS